MARCIQTPRRSVSTILARQSSMRGRKVRGSSQQSQFYFELPQYKTSAHSLCDPGWKCCKPRVLTFDEFLSIPPCTTGKHSTTDIPPAIEKKSGGDVSESTTPTLKPSTPTPEASRGPVSAPQPTVTPPPPPPESEDDEPNVEVPKGKICRRKACGSQYDGSSREGEKCVFHPGAPIFHEGSKGYTCCKRRVLEFDEFMKIEGCQTKDKHMFIGSGKKKAVNSGGEEHVETVR